MNQNEMGEAPHSLPPLGPLVPVRAGSKGHAHMRNWQKVSPTVLQEVMAKHPGCNVGLRLDNFLALDPDSDKAVIYLGRLELAGKLPATVAWRSLSGRITRLYRLPPGAQVKPFGPGSNDLCLELRTGRGYQCLIPPSHVDGKRYAWVNDPWATPVAVLPAETLERIQELVRPAKTLKTGKGGGGQKTGSHGKAQKDRPPSSLPPDRIAEGQRNTALFRQGRSMRGRGAEREEIEAYLQELNREKCAPPLEAGEVEGIARSVARYPVNSFGSALLLLRVTYDQVIMALEALGGRERWIRRAALVKRLKEMTGIPGNLIRPPVSTPTIERCLRRMVVKRLISHRKGGWYRLPRTKAGS